MRKSTLALLLLLAGFGFMAWFLLRDNAQTQGSDASDASDSLPGGDAAPGLEGAGLARPKEGAPSGRSGSEGAHPPWPVGAPESETPGRGRVFVRLVDSAGKPLAHHPIEVDWWKAFAVMGRNSGHTDKQGLFRTEANAPWELDSVGVPLSGSKANLLYHSGPFAAPRSRPNEVVVEVPRTGTVRGRVTDLEGHPIQTVIGCDAAPVLGADPFQFRMRINDREVETDATGRFQLTLVAGRYEIYSPNARLKLVARAHVTIDENRPDASVDIRAARPLEGRQLEVRVKGVEDPRKGTLRISAETKSLVFPPQRASAGVEYSPARQQRGSRRLGPGHYVIDHVLGDPWTLSIWGSSSGLTRIPIPAGATHMEVTLTPRPAEPEQTLRLVGRLPDGRTVRPSVQRRSGPTLSGSGFGVSAFDGVEGEPVTLRGPYTFHLVLSYGGMAFVGVGPLQAGGAPSRIEVPFEKAREARVEVLDAQGRPVPAEIQLAAAWAFFRPVLPSGQTDAGSRAGYTPVVLDTHRIITEDGSATFGRLGSTAFRVLVKPTDPDLPPARGVVRAGETLRLVLGAGLKDRVTLSGRIVDAQTGAPIAGACVEATTLDGESEAGYVEGMTNAEGLFQSHGLPALRTRVFIRSRGYAFSSIDAVDLSRSREPLRIKLLRARRLPLRVLDAGGQPVETALVQVQRGGGTIVQLQDRYGNRDGDIFDTDAAGRVDLFGVPAARVTIEVILHDGTPSASFEVDAREPLERLVTLRLP